MADLREDVEMKIELVEDENKEHREGSGKEVREDEGFKDEGYEEDVGEYLEGGDEVPFSGFDDKPQRGFVEELDKKPLIEERKNDEQPLLEEKRVIVVACEKKRPNDDVMKPDELVVASRVVIIDEKPAEVLTGNERSNGGKEGTTALEEKTIRDEVDNAGESGKKKKKKNKQNSKKLHKIFGKKEDKHEENVDRKMTERLAKKVDEPATKMVIPNDTSSVPVKPARAQGSATNGRHHAQDRKTRGPEVKSNGMNTVAADEKKGRTITSNQERKGTDATGVVHKPKQPVPETVATKSPEKMVLSEDKIWDQINALRAIVGYATASRHKSCIEELKDLYIFTGVEPPLSLFKATDLEEAADKLQFLMSVVGVK